MPCHWQATLQPGDAVVGYHPVKELLFYLKVTQAPTTTLVGGYVYTEEHPTGREIDCPLILLLGRLEPYIFTFTERAGFPDSLNALLFWVDGHPDWLFEDTGNLVYSAESSLV